MDQMTRSMKGYPWGGFSAIFATALLFTALPLLTRIQVDRPVGSAHQPVFITPYKPSPPPTENREQPEKQKMLEKEINRENEQIKRVKPKFDMLGTGITANSNEMEWVTIDPTPQTVINVTKRRIALNPDEVDQPPRYLRTSPPQYPYHAKRDSIEGKVLLRFVVDIDGLAKEAEVVKAEPAGVFDEAALKALERYKFKPAVKDGKAVMCNAALMIAFVLD